MEPDPITTPPRYLQLPLLMAEGSFDFVATWQRLCGANTPQQLPPIPYVVPPRQSLSALLEIHGNGPVEPVLNREQWQAKRRLLRDNLLWLLGEQPACPTTVTARLAFETACQGYVRRKMRLQLDRQVSSKVVFQSTRNGYAHRRVLLNIESETVPAYLCIPTAPPRVPRPAVICLHQFNPEEGARETVGLDPQHNDMAFADELARRGFVTLAFDLPGYGERRDPKRSPVESLIDFYRAHPKGSLLGEMAWEVSRAVDYLATVEGVDSQRIGCIGHVLGGIVALFAAALDERLRAVVASAACATFRSQFESGTADQIWFNGTGLLPHLGFFRDGQLDDLPIEIHEVVAQIAPRALYLCTPERSDYFPREGVQEVARHLENLYSFLGFPERLAVNYPSYFIYFPEDLREEAYQWLTRFL
jgi:pimeloyl-ACP methyl ester carboxylesterase